MSMTLCPGCGLPRLADQVGTVPCPVCDDGAGPSGKVAPPPARTARPDPTAGMATDAGQLALQPADMGGFPRWLLWAAVFLLGTAVGAAGVLGWQAASRPSDGVATAPPSPKPPVSFPEAVAVAPMPHEPRPAGGAEPKPEPPPGNVVEPKAIALPEKRTVIELGNQPDLVYTLPFAMKNGEAVVLKGKVKTLRLPALDGGSILDASGLETSVVVAGGKVDNKSVLRVNAPGGTVMFAAAVSGNSTVEVNAPGGEVKFVSVTTGTSPGSQIDGGSVVTITARTVELFGDLNGIETAVTVNLSRGGSLRAKAVRGLASLQYRVADGFGAVPDATADVVTPTATFRRLK